MKSLRFVAELASRSTELKLRTPAPSFVNAGAQRLIPFQWIELTRAAGNFQHDARFLLANIFTVAASLARHLMPDVWMATCGGLIMQRDAWSSSGHSSIGS